MRRRDRREDGGPRTGDAIDRRGAIRQLSMTPHPGALVALATAVALLAGPAAGSDPDRARWLRLAVERMCPQPGLSGLDAQHAIPGSWLLHEERRPADGEPRRIVVRLLLPVSDELTVERRQFRGRLRQFRASYAVRHGHTAGRSFRR